MRRLLHTVLGAWFLIAMTMAQGCVSTAKNSGAYDAHAKAPVGSSANSSPPTQWDRSQNAANNAPINTKDFVPDPSASNALTEHFKSHRLPLVGAQVLRNPNNGSRAVVLYGFVGSDYGKSDAQRQADDFINDSSVEVDNRIRVNPDLLAAGGSPTPSPDASTAPDPQAQANAGPPMPGVQSYIDQQNQTAQLQQYQQQNPMGSMSSMVPLIALLGMLGAGMAGGSSGGYLPGSRMGPYGYSSPYGNSPFGSPFGGYPSMAPPTFATPGYGFGSPGYGFGSMPGRGVTPFGGMPGSPYYYSR